MNKPVYPSLRSLSVLTLTGLAWVGLAQPSWSESSVSSIQTSPIVFNDPTPPSQGAPSGRQRGGASRGPCRRFEALTALVPLQNGKVWGQTIRDRPVFWFYLPNQLTEQTPIELTVQDANDNYIYSTRLAPQTKSGLIRLALPATAKPLEAGKSYSWTFSVYCDPAKPSSAVFVQGTIQRITPVASLQSRLSKTASIEQVNLYAAHGIWYEAFDILAELYRRQPNEPTIVSAWNSLLQQVKLDRLAKTPLSECCTEQLKQSAKQSLKPSSQH